MHHPSILLRASFSDMNPFSFRHSRRNLPLYNSTVALSVGVPGREKSIRIPRSYTHLSSIFLQILKPLSVFSNCRQGRLSAMLFSISATSVEPRFWPRQILRYSRVNKSIAVSRRKRRPSNSASETKSMPRTGFGYNLCGCGYRCCADLFRRGHLRRRDRPCSL